MARLPERVSVALPEWLSERLPSLPDALTEAQAVDLTLELARQNFEQDTGGPFAAVVLEKASGRLVSVGVNRAVPESCSSAHAEVTALSLAQQALGSFDLGGKGLPEHALIVSWRPCVMCFGALIWSGIRTLVTAGSGPELERLTGFDEGPMIDDWQSALRARGIEVKDAVALDRAIQVVRAFSESGRLVYNARRG
ncbi:MAG: nucleoside deaminase [Myxococcota bacterium]|nr:nucleoside deaminase [Myxococcota bacterium]